MNNDDHDTRDPLRAAFDDHQRAPRDVVHRRVGHALDDLRRLADCSTTVEVTHYEYDEHGVTRHTEHVTITHPINNPRRENQ